MSDPAVRRAELAKIHIGAKQICDDDAAYRDMLQAVAGARSAADLDAAGRRRVIEHLRSCGAVFRPSPPKRAGRRQPPRPRPSPDVEALVRKIDALLINHPGGRKPREYAEGILRHMTGHPHRAPLEWAKPYQLVKVVQALGVDRRRHAGGGAAAGG